jgi:hypothetical protein
MQMTHPLRALSVAVLLMALFPSAASALNVGEVCAESDPADCSSKTYNIFAECTAVSGAPGTGKVCRRTPQCSGDAECPSGKICQKFVDPYGIYHACVTGDRAAETAPPPAVTGVVPQLQKAPERGLISPKLEVLIPFVEFSQAVKAGDYVTVPFLAQYLTGVYRFLLTVVGTVASVMIAVGGFQYLTAGGDKARVDAGKKRIENAVVGMILALGSYALLYAINPSLVRFQGLQLSSAQTNYLDLLETGAYDRHTEDLKGGQPLPPSNVGSPELDKLFEAYSNCVGLNPAILKAVAYAESGLKPNDGADCTKEAEGKNCFVGLYQLYKPYCVDRVKDLQREPKITYLKQVLKEESDCTIQNRADPEVNMALYALKAEENLSGILKCGEGITLQDFILTLYVHHNNGPGVGKYITSHAAEDGCHYVGAATDYDSCKAEDGKNEGMRKWVRSFYETKGTPLKGKGCNVEKLKAYGTVTDDTKSFGCITADYGEVKMCYGFKIAGLAKKWGADSVYIKKDPTKCPLNTNTWVLPRK